MNTIQNLRIFFAVALCSALFSVGALAQKYERNVEKKFTVQGNPTVRVEGKFGPITVKGTDADMVDVQVRISVEDDSYDDAKELAEDVDITVEGSKNDVHVEVDWNGSQSSGSKHSLNMSIEVRVPKKTILDIENKFGSISISDVAGSVAVKAQFGSIEATRCSNVDSKNAFGSTTLNVIRGGMKIQSKNGKVRVFNVEGGEISNAFGAIEVSDASAPVMIQGRMGSITAKNIPGGHIVNSYGSTKIWLVRDFSGTIQAKTRFGDIDSDFPLRSRYKNDEARYGPVPEDLVGRVGSGKGKLSVLNEFGDITIRRR